ncbi:MAG TPA: sugar transferase [Solirubrobacteraceae bacterium]|nr:sugar transferase [Solirubrobacteraceae bacterium]
MAVHAETLELQLLARGSDAARQRFRHLRRLLFLADMFAGVASGALVGVVARGSSEQVLLLAVVVAVAWPLAAFLCGLYAREDLRAWASGVSEAPRLVLTCLAVSWPMYALLVAMGLPRPAAGAFCGAIVCGTVAGLARSAARVSAHRAPKLRQRTLIVGSGLVAERLAERINDHPELGLVLTGFIDDGAGDQGTTDIPCLGGLSALSDLVELDLVDRVMIAFTRAHHEELLHALRVCRDAGVAVDIVPRLFEFLDGARSIEQIGGMPLLSIDAPTFSAPSRVSKRTLDLVGASLALVVLSPILLAIALAIKLDSRGPVLFTQLRSGRGGKFFKLYKFRSMHTAATVEVRADGAIVKTRDDERITRVGRVIRRLSLDEAPQLFNVLMADMSLVGPRPLVMAEAQTLTESWQARRADLRPGLTGPWQISGRSNIPFQEMIRFDYQYVAGWSLARDVEILLATLPVVLSGRGAY